MGFVRTRIDEFVALLAQGSRDTASLSSALGWSEAGVEKAARILERVGALRLSYPLSITSKPELSLSRKAEEPKRQGLPQGKPVDGYEIELENGITVPVRIIYFEAEKQPTYFADIPFVSHSTAFILQSAKDEIAKALPPEQAGMGQEAKAELVRKREAAVRSQVESAFGSEEKELAQLCGIVTRDMFGLGDIDILMRDDGIEEITLNKAASPLFIYHRKHGWLKSNIAFGDEDKIYNLASLIGRKVGKQVSSLFPLLDAHLASGDRVNATIFPISALGNAVTIRKFSKNPITIIDLLRSNNLSFPMAAFLWQAIHYERSVIVSGGTASGKTTMLNALLALVPPRQRTITIEDTRELELPSTQENWVALRTRTKNPEGFGEVTMLDLLVNSLRMRPDRIVMGEIRKKEEAEVLFEAMHTGHSTYGTVHADTAAQLVERLIEPPFSLPPMQVSSLDLVVVQYRDRRSGKRRTLSITEVLYGKEKPRLLGLFAHKPRQDSFCSLNKPKKYYSLLALHTGMTEREIIRDQIGKRSVLRWMVRRKMCDTHTIGRVMREYYNCSEALVKAARKNANPAKVL